MHKLVENPLKSHIIGLMGISSNLKRIRKQKGMSMYALAKMIGKHRSTILRIENKESDPVLSLVEKIAKALKVSVDKLVK